MSGIEPTTDRSDGIHLFRVQLTVLVVIYTVAAFSGIFWLTRSLAYDSLRAQGASYFALVVDMRNWNSSHGGVWVLKSDDVKTNPFLAKLGVQPDLKTTDGDTLTLRNPSAMTREVSDLTMQRSGVSFHLTATDYVNPANSPDDWEREALGDFESGADVRAGVDVVDGQRYYRYMAPLKVDDDCLRCHGGQGYVVGDQRGGVTISIPMADTDRLLRRAAAFLSGLMLITLTGSLVTIQVLATRMETRVNAANDQLRTMAITDALTGVLNRGATLSRLEQESERASRTGEPLSLIMLDLDNFKRVNDTYGHGTGDCALKVFAARVAESIRAYDVIGRIGGEEFLVIAPGADSSVAFRLAERVLDRIRSTPAECDPYLVITASAGIATMTSAQDTVDALILRADSALYEAKHTGRDRATMWSGDEPGTDTPDKTPTAP